MRGLEMQFLAVGLVFGSALAACQASPSASSDDARSMDASAAVMQPDAAGAQGGPAGSRADAEANASDAATDAVARGASDAASADSGSAPSVDAGPPEAGSDGAAPPPADASPADAAQDAPADAGPEASAVDAEPGPRDESRLWLYDGFEAASLGDAWRPQGCEAWSIEVATEGYRDAPAPSVGERMLRFETRPGDRKPVACAPGSTGHRAEIHLAQRFEVGSDIWIGFRLYLPESFDLVGKTYVMQIHGHEPEANGGCVGVDRVTPMTWLRIENRQAAFVYGQHARRGSVGEWALDESDLGRWHDLVVHYRPSPDAAGRLEVWWDETRTIDDRGLNMCAAARPYLKLGLYQSDHNTAYYDEVRVGSPAAGYGDVAP